jgi:hypothetical protein
VVTSVIICGTVANLAYGRQDLKLDFELFRKTVERQKNLKFVILELSYHRLTHTNPKNYWHNGLYRKYSGITNLEEASLILS